MPNNLVFNNVANQLLTQIYGTDGKNVLAIKTDSCGRLEVVGTFTAVVTEKIVELKADIIDVGGTGTAMTVDTSGLTLYSFYVHNLGTNEFKVKLQISPVNNDSYFVDDKSGIITIDPIATFNAVLIPRCYLKFTRLQYEAPSGNISAEVWFNGRS